METVRHLKVADEMWIAGALLQRERGLEGDFSPREIVGRAELEGLSVEQRPGVLLHAQYHAVASRPPNPGRYCMLTETSRGRRRLFKPGDPCDSKRIGAKTHPNPLDLPEKYRYLVDWYLNEYVTQKKKSLHPMDELREWAHSARPFRGVDPDAYVRELRAGWDK